MPYLQILVCFTANITAIQTDLVNISVPMYGSSTFGMLKVFLFTLESLFAIYVHHLTVLFHKTSATCPEVLDSNFFCNFYCLQLAHFI